MVLEAFGKQGQAQAKPSVFCTKSKQAEEAGATRRGLEKSALLRGWAGQKAATALYLQLFYSLLFMGDIDLCLGHDPSTNLPFVRSARSQLEPRIQESREYIHPLRQTPHSMRSYGAQLTYCDTQLPNCSECLRFQF